MKRAGLFVGALTASACLWASGPASALSTGCSAAVTQATTDAFAFRAAYVTYASDVIARNTTKAATDRAAALAVLHRFIVDIAVLKTACAAG
jgi:hypothetical protein